MEMFGNGPLWIVTVIAFMNCMAIILCDQLSSCLRLDEPDEVRRGFAALFDAVALILALGAVAIGVALQLGVMLMTALFAATVVVVRRLHRLP